MRELRLPDPNVTLSGSVEGHTLSAFQAYWSDILQDDHILAMLLNDLNSHFRGKTVGVLMSTGEEVLYDHDVRQWFVRSPVIRALHGKE